MKKENATEVLIRRFVLLRFAIAIPAIAGILFAIRNWQFKGKGDMRVAGAVLAISFLLALPWFWFVDLLEKRALRRLSQTKA